MIAFRRPAACRRDPRGMTLVELLVVAGLVAVFLGLVVTGVRGGKRQKETAEDLASLLASAQGRALGVPEGAAAILDPSGAGGGVYCTNGFDAEMLPLIDAGVTGLPPTNLAATTATGSFTLRNGDDIRRAYRILLSTRTDDRYAPSTAWMRFQAASETTGEISFSRGQTTSNTVWPRRTTTGTFDALLAQYPVKSSAVAEFDPATAVDLRFSGVEDDRNEGYSSLDRKGAIAVVFDRVGRVAEIMQGVPPPGSIANFTTPPQPHVPTSAIYFLVVPRDEVAAGKNTLANKDALWVALAPQSGRVIVAENVVVSGSDSQAVFTARTKAREGISIGK